MGVPRLHVAPRGMGDSVARVLYEPEGALYGSLVRERRGEPVSLNQMRKVVDVYGVLDARAAPEGALELRAPPVVQRSGYDGVQPPAAPNPSKRVFDKSRIFAKG